LIVQNVIVINFLARKRSKKGEMNQDINQPTLTKYFKGKGNVLGGAELNVVELDVSDHEQKMGGTVVELDVSDHDQKIVETLIEISSDDNDIILSCDELFDCPVCHFIADFELMKGHYKVCKAFG
jgi:O-acetylhomoserine/O-acetylserine sulfhydrylase-like pyridoxal-dependent enzyme